MWDLSLRRQLQHPQRAVRQRQAADISAQRQAVQIPQIGQQPVDNIRGDQERDGREHPEGIYDPAIIIDRKHFLAKEDQIFQIFITSHPRQAVLMIVEKKFLRLVRQRSQYRAIRQ